MQSSKLISFPTMVNSNAARVVAGGVVILVLIVETTHNPVALGLLVYGFLVRALSGPRFSPLGQFAVRVVAPRLGAGSLVPGAPKRFAQCIGLVFSSTATVFALAGSWGIAETVLALLGLFAALESILGICAGCTIFGALQRWGVIQERCASCSDISGRLNARVTPISESHSHT